MGAVMCIIFSNLIILKVSPGQVELFKILLGKLSLLEDKEQSVLKRLRLTGVTQRDILKHGKLPTSQTVGSCSSRFCEYSPILRWAFHDAAVFEFYLFL